MVVMGLLLSINTKRGAECRGDIKIGADQPRVNPEPFIATWTAGLATWSKRQKLTRVSGSHIKFYLSPLSLRMYATRDSGGTRTDGS